jgi:hypothetical protein
VNPALIRQQVEIPSSKIQNSGKLQILNSKKLRFYATGWSLDFELSLKGVDLLRISNLVLSSLTGLESPKNTCPTDKSVG